MDHTRYLIIGGGIAGVSAARAVRERDTEGRVVLLGDEELPYRRPMLTKMLSSEDLSEQGIAVMKPQRYEELGIELIRDRVRALDTVNRVASSDSHSYHYDKCIYATGASAHVPPALRCDSKTVLTVRTMEDVRRFRALLPIGRAVVIGGGILGLEAAWEMSRMGTQVTVLEAAPNLLFGRITEDAARIFEQSVCACGVEIRVGAEVEGITPFGKGTTVHIRGADPIIADAVLVSCGNRANTEIAAKAGIKVDVGVVVDEQMRTDCDGVFSAGDCARFKGSMCGMWKTAADMGAVAGANAAGADEVFVHEAVPIAFMGMNTRVFAIGDTGTGKREYQTVSSADTDDRQLEQYFFCDGRLVGAQVINKPPKKLQLGQSYESFLQN